MNLSPLRTTGLPNGPASIASYIGKADGIQGLTTLIRLHSDYFNCSKCQNTLHLLNSGNVELDTLITDMQAHLAEHWLHPSTEDGTDADA